MKKSRKNAQKIDENVKLYDLIELRPDIWLQIWIFWEILVPGTLSLASLSFQEVCQGYAKDLNKIAPKEPIFFCASTLHLSS